MSPEAPGAVQMGAVSTVGRVVDVGQVVTVGPSPASPVPTAPEPAPGRACVDCGAPVASTARGRSRLRCEGCKRRYKADDRRGTVVRSCPVCADPAAPHRSYCAEHGAGSLFAAEARNARRRGAR